MSLEKNITHSGTVISVDHPLVTVAGLTKIHAGEVVTFENGAIGQIIDLDEKKTTVMVFSRASVPIGSKVRPTGKPITIATCPDLLGKVIDPFGEVIGNLSGAAAEEKKPGTHGAACVSACEHALPQEMRSIDIAPRQLTDRVRITEQMHCGIGAVDALFPIGKGQRQLIVGDRKTGKTSFLQDITVNQASSGTIVILALVGKKIADIKSIAEFLQAKGVAKNCVVVATTAKDPASTISLTPFSAMTIAEYFRDHGHNCLVILDDLSRHAQFYRELALLSKQFPGRDSYPGDIFFVHARLLERAGAFATASNKNNSATITCLPVAETISNDLTDYITSNLISITDGHLLFDARLFSQGSRPAISTSLSVTRVGKQTQEPISREMTLVLQNFINQYESMLALTHFGNELNQETRQTLLRGNQIRQLFNQKPGIQTIPEVMEILITGVLLGWFAQYPTQSLAAARESLHFVYREQTHASVFESLRRAPNLTAFTASVSELQDTILSLCQR